MKVSLTVAVVLVSAFVIAMLAGIGGEHGPGRHGGRGGTTPSSDVGEHRSPPNHSG